MKGVPTLVLPSLLLISLLPGTAGFTGPRHLTSLLLRNGHVRRTRRIPSRLINAVMDASAVDCAESMRATSNFLLSQSSGVEGPWQSYLQLLAEAPLPTKAVTAGLIIGSGDAAAQAIESSLVTSNSLDPLSEADRSAEVTTAATGVDLTRLARWAAFGFFLQAPWNHFFYLALDGALPPTEEPFTMTTATKVFIDQFVQAPIFTAVIFIFFAVVEGRGLNAGKRQIDEELFQVLLKNWAVFLPATIINLAFLPNELRVLFLNSVFFFWTIFLSLTVNANKDAVPVEK